MSKLAVAEAGISSQTTEMGNDTMVHNIYPLERRRRIALHAEYPW